MFTDEKPDGEWKDISIEELSKIIKENEEIEIDLDDFAAMYETQSADDALRDEIETEIHQLYLFMKQALEKEDYFRAFGNAKELRYKAYQLYKDEIDDCYKVCADHGVKDAIIYEANRYTTNGDGRVKTEAFPYLLKLSEIGYIKSFKWLADCYYQGIGCGKDVKRAELLFLEGMIFDGNEYCRKKYIEMHPELEDYKGDDLLKKIIRNIAYKDPREEDYGRIKMAELILDGRIKQYRPETGYVLLKSLEYAYDGISYYRLGECVHNGIGTTPDPIVAQQLLEEAQPDLEWITSDFSDPFAKELMEKSLHDEKDYLEAYENMRRLLDEAKSKIERIGDLDLMCRYDGVVEEWQIFEEWRKEKPLFIKRS